MTGQKTYSLQQAREQLDKFAERWGIRYDHNKKLTSRGYIHIILRIWTLTCMCSR